MASITSLMSSSSGTSSIYGNRNVLSGLATGMDTEAMIENAVSGIKSKITSLLQKRTKVEWQQTAYRSIIDKAVNFNLKYTSYTSPTNLLSNSFFTNAVNTAVNGTYADKVTASGKSSSDIKINAVKQMATATTYSVSGLGGVSSGDIANIVGGEGFDIGGTIPVSTVSGSLTFQYGGSNGSSFSISFDALENLDEIEVLDKDGNVVEDPSNTQKLAQAIKNKLSEVTYTYSKNGFQETTTADKAINVEVDPVGGISFSDGLGNGNSVKISSVTGDIGTTLGISKGDTGIRRIMADSKPLVEDTPVKDYLADKTIGFTFNGTTKTINFSDVLDKVDFSYDSGKDHNTQFVEALQGQIDKAFGGGKIDVAYTDDGKLSFKTRNDGDLLSLGGTGIKALGFETGDSNYINTGKKITDILGDKAGTIFTEANRLKGEGAITQKTSPNGTVYYVDEKGSRVDEDGYRIDSDGKAIYDFEVNGAHINVTEDTTLESLVNAVNSNPDTGVKISYSKLTNEFKFTTTETGANSKIELNGLAKDMFGVSQARNIGEEKFSDAFGVDFGTSSSKTIAFQVSGGMSMAVQVNADDTVQDVLDKINDPSTLFAHGGDSISINELTGELMVTNKDGESLDFTFAADVTYKPGVGFEGGTELVTPTNPYVSYTSGQDAIMDVEINGVRFENLTRSANTFDLDGLTISVKGEFEAKAKEDGEDYEPITFTTTTDTEKIIDAIRSFVADYNEMASELKSAYSTLPAQQTDGSRYDPLTSDQEAGMTESEIAAYNEKAQQGLLFGDTTLSSFYSKLLSAITPGGTDGQTLREIGIGTSYSDGMTTLSLDEDKLRTALENDPDKVRTAFTKTKEGGATSDGLMQTMQNTLNTYVKTTGEPKGALIVHAGSVKAPTSLNSNSLLTQMNSIDNQITRYQDKMTTQIDRYNTMFTRLETLVAQMNSQYSALSGLMGGTEGY